MPVALAQEDVSVVVVDHPLTKQQWRDKARRRAEGAATALKRDLEGTPAPHTGVMPGERSAANPKGCRFSYRGTLWKWRAVCTIFSERPRRAGDTVCTVLCDSNANWVRHEATVLIHIERMKLKDGSFGLVWATIYSSRFSFVFRDG
ncbi:MAG TPA: hypothetical protein VMR98_02965 [Candidatus Polarisedimenticolaceae bacterium]|nr:hypothetical protein [Candidatus Polarisedimenticolaceae bacterium]